MTFWQFFLYYILSTGLLSLIGFIGAGLVLLAAIIYYNHEDKVEAEKRKIDRENSKGPWYEKGS